MAWTIAAGSPQGAVIIEDDIRLHGDPLDFEPRGDLVYLSRKFMQPAGPPEDGLTRAPYHVLAQRLLDFARRSVEAAQGHRQAAVHSRR